MNYSQIFGKDAFECFKNAKVVYMITYGKNGEIHSRPMTNFNDDPNNEIWFPSYRNTQKIKDIENNPKTLILYPGKEKDMFYELVGEAQLADKREVDDKWVWWYLYWHPEMKEYFWFDKTSNHPERVVINIKPERVKTLDKKDITWVDDTYSTLIPKKE